MPETHTASSGSKKRDKKNNKKATDGGLASTARPTNEPKNAAKVQKTKKEKTKDKNSNINKSLELNVNICKDTNKRTDEVIDNNSIESASIVTEEFDFDDADLKELDATAEIGVNMESDETGEDCMRNIESDTTTSYNKTEQEVTPITNDLDRITLMKNKSEHLDLTQVIKMKDREEESDLSLNVNFSSPVGSPLDEHTKQKPSPPSALEFQTKDDNMTTSEESYCPITPRRIVDVEEINEHDAPNRVLRCSSSKIIKSNQSKDAISDNNDSICANELSKTASSGDLGHNDDYDENDEPDEHLLVQFLGEANRIAEARLAARRQARAEAREIRMRELERQQKEQEQNADRVFDMHASSGIDPLARARLTVGINNCSPVGGLLNSVRGNSMSSRRSSEDSLEEEGRSLRDIRHELRDVEERFRKAMIANAQLDNERASQSYQIQLLKDKLEEIEESYAQLQREFKEKSRDCNALKRNLDKLTEEVKLVQGQLNERDTLIAEQGLVIVTVENEDGSDAKRALVSCENAHLLGSVQGSLDVRLKKFNEEKQQLQTEVQQLQEQLQHFKNQGKGRGSSMNGPTNGDEEYEAQREANKIISDFKYKLQKAEQEIANLQASLARSETQVIRYKSTAEAAEKAEADLKIERRKLQRENREAMERLEELETSNNHLLKRLDKLKNAKSALLKDL